MLKSFEGRERDRKYKYATAKKLTCMWSLYVIYM